MLAGIYNSTMCIITEQQLINPTTLLTWGVDVRNAGAIETRPSHRSTMCVTPVHKAMNFVHRESSNIIYNQIVLRK